MVLDLLDSWCQIMCLCVYLSLIYQKKEGWFCSDFRVSFVTGLMSFPDLILKFERACRNVSESIRFVHNYSAYTCC